MTIVLLFILLAVLLGGYVYHRRVTRSVRKIYEQSQRLARGEELYEPSLSGISKNLTAINLRLQKLDNRVDAGKYSLQTILASMAEGVVIMDAQGVIQMDNKTFREMFLIEDNPLGKRVWDISSHPEIKALIEESLHGHKQSFGELVYEDILDNRNQRKFFRVSVSTLGSGTAHGAVAVFHDVSRLVQLEDLRKEFVANVSHELRTPLSIFHGYLETLLEHPDLPPEEEKRIYQVMRRHSDRLNSLVEDLLTLSRLESGQTQLNCVQLSVKLLFEQLKEDWGPKFLTKECVLKFALPDPTFTVTADKFRMEQVFYNLLENALKYSDVKGQVEVGLVTGKDQKSVEFYVQDSGAGIPSNKVDQIFQRFFRVDKARTRDKGGTGLGLAIVKHIVQLHGGRVWAESALGKGTTVWFSLPVLKS